MLLKQLDSLKKDAFSVCQNAVIKYVLSLWVFIHIMQFYESYIYVAIS